MKRGENTLVSSEGDEFIEVVYTADPPRRRDFWRVLRGRWTPEVRRVELLTLKGMHRELKAVWTGPAIDEQMLQESPLLELIEDPEHPPPPGTLYVRRSTPSN